MEITPDLVKRVSERIASGIPIRLALAGEGVTVSEYKDHLFNHPEPQAIQDVEMRKFLENAINMLLECENRGVHNPLTPVGRVHNFAAANVAAMAGGVQPFRLPLFTTRH
jgi:hypothetical protein